MKSNYKLVLLLTVIILALVAVAGCSNKQKAIATAIANGDTATVQNLLDQGVSPNSKADDGKSLLMLAAYLGQTDIVDLLIARGADVNAKDKDGKTALMYAAEKGNTDAAKLLLEHGADINAIDNDGKTALQIARDNNQVAMVDLLNNWGKTASATNPEATATPSAEAPATPNLETTTEETTAPAPETTPAPTSEVTTTPAPTAPPSTSSLNQQLKSIFFDFDKSDLRPDQMQILDGDLAVLKAHPGLYIVLGAHADERGTRDYNLELSARRAAAVKEYLIKAGIAEDHFVVYAFGKDHPLKKGNDEASMSFNRRVDILMWETELSGTEVLQETIK